LVVKHYQSYPIPEEKPRIQKIQQENQKPNPISVNFFFFKSFENQKYPLVQVKPIQSYPKPTASNDP
jgi:hypothetical protein